MYIFLCPLRSLYFFFFFLTLINSLHAPSSNSTSPSSLLPAHLFPSFVIFYSFLVFIFHFFILSLNISLPQPLFPAPATSFLPSKFIYLPTLVYIFMFHPSSLFPCMYLIFYRNLLSFFCSDHNAFEPLPKYFLFLTFNFPPLFSPLNLFIQLPYLYFYLIAPYFSLPLSLILPHRCTLSCALGYSLTPLVFLPSWSLTIISPSLSLTFAYPSTSFCSPGYFMSSAYYFYLRLQLSASLIIRTFYLYSLLFHLFFFLFLSLSCLQFLLCVRVYMYTHTHT